ncbi:unnamed protein product [Protopolystoma xenopodis]|uniref:Transcription and mRNA export factor ENY2 n=1 Tax=Protopolystoma xenopodis TaxID=117903 RepID=A0A448WEK9_9PLAT|nr:unnamed protein product [Protopolystoma xenopodis]
MSDRRAEIRAKINDLLVQSGERNRLKDYIESRLIENGWTEKVKSACKDYIRGKGVDNITVEEVVNAIAPSARQVVPIEIKQEVLEMLRKFLIQNDIDM